MTNSHSPVTGVPTNAAGSRASTWKKSRTRSECTFIFAAVFLFITPVTAQTAKFWVFFTDKSQGSAVTADPVAIERRNRLGIDAGDADSVVSLAYIHSVEALTDSLGYYSRWLNAVAIYAHAQAAEKLRSLPFVRAVVPVGGEMHPATFEDVNTPEEDVLVQLAQYQVSRMQGKAFAQAGLNGKGIRIAVLDAGFSNANRNAALRHIFADKRIIRTYDFYTKDTIRWKGDLHGTWVLTNIAGQWDSLTLGLATGAEFLLARTENAWSEGYGEEDKWIAGLEWAEINGAQIVNSSLGYSYSLHFPEELNGRSPMSIAADKAAALGVLVVSSAGNDYAKPWKYIAIPADAKDILTVGGTDPSTDLQAYFSSVGPTADGRLKPEISAPGITAVCHGEKLAKAIGTSFAAPLATGFAACVLQYHPSFSPAQLKNSMIRSGHLYPYFDYAHGYGIPQASHILGDSSGHTPTFTARLDSQLVYFAPLHYDPSKKTRLFYHLREIDGPVMKYGVVEIHSAEPLYFCPNYRNCLESEHFVPGDRNRVTFISLDYPEPYFWWPYSKGRIVSLHYEGYTIEISL